MRASLAYYSLNTRGIEMAVKNIKGKRPRTGGWSEVGTVEDSGQCWIVFIRPDEEWSTVKVVADGYAPTKANYWLGWNGSRFSRATDLVALAQQRPAVLEGLERVLRSLVPVEGLDLL